MKTAKQIQQQLDEIIEKTQSNAKPVVAVYGLVNAGKSTLLNMLTDPVGEEHFKTADWRTTSATESFETEHCIYLDTPGMDYSAEDNQTAQNAIPSADIVLFVHQAEREFDQEEIDLLQKLSEQFHPSADQNILIVLTKIDKKDDDGLNAITKAMQAQCKKFLGWKPRIFPISNTRYQKGMREEKQTLISLSHMSELQTHLESLLPQVPATRIGRCSQDIERLFEETRVLIKARNKEKNTMRKEMQELFDDFNLDMTEFKKSSVKLMEEIA